MYGIITITNNKVLIRVDLGKKDGTLENPYPHDGFYHPTTYEKMRPSLPINCHIYPDLEMTKPYLADNYSVSKGYTQEHCHHLCSCTNIGIKDFDLESVLFTSAGIVFSKRNPKLMDDYMFPFGFHNNFDCNSRALLHGFKEAMRYPSVDVIRVTDNDPSLKPPALILSASLCRYFFFLVKCC